MALAEDCPAPRAVATEEALPLKDGSLDLVTSVLSLHLVNDLPGALIQIRRALRPDGLFLGAILGGETLIELRQAFVMAETETLGGVSPRIFPTADVRDMGGLLQRAGFALPVVDFGTLDRNLSHSLGLGQRAESHGGRKPARCALKKADAAGYAHPGARDLRQSLHGRGRQGARDFRNPLPLRLVAS